MNERIKQLAEEAELNATLLFNKEKLEKFAQLIVAECVQCIELWRDATDDQMDADTHWQGYRSGCDDSIVEIKQHFGVEE